MRIKWVQRISGLLKKRQKPGSNEAPRKNRRGLTEAHVEVITNIKEVMARDEAFCRELHRIVSRTERVGSNRRRGLWVQRDRENGAEQYQGDSPSTEEVSSSDQGSHQATEAFRPFAAQHAQGPSEPGKERDSKMFAPVRDGKRRYTLPGLRQMFRLCNEPGCTFNHVAVMTCWHCSGGKAMPVFQQQATYLELLCFDCGQVSWQIEISNGFQGLVKK